jgi:para-nitrobenzyl esterase
MPDVPSRIAEPRAASFESKVQYLADPITVGGVANLNSLSVFDVVYTTVRGTPFAARAAAVSKATP